MIFAFSRRLFFLLGALSVAVSASDSFGYALENKSWASGSVITWDMELGAPSQPLQDGSVTWNQAAAPALADWNAEMGNVQMNYVMDSSKPVSSGDGVNTASFASSVFGDSFGTGVLAVTYYRYQNGTMMEADILFNNAQTFESYRGELQFNSQGKCICDIQRVFLHEVGHALGLNHPDSPPAHQSVSAIMNSVVSNLSALSADDIAGIRFLYGSLTAPPTPTPGPSATPSGTPGAPSRLVNISTRMQVGTGSDVLIGGFIIQGNQLKKIILRAVGPSLSESGVAGALQDPKMELYDESGALLDSNDNWQESPDSGAIIESTIAPSDPRESAIVARLGPGNYTVVVSGVNNATGVGLVESYTLDTNAAHAANISTRGQVGTAEDALIGGFIVRGNTFKRIIVRALGPSLAANGFSGVLDNPLVELRDGNGQLIAQNDDWGSGGQRDEIIATGIPPNDPRESALIATIPTGNFTAVVRGADGGQGIGLVEIYDLDQ